MGQLHTMGSLRAANIARNSEWNVGSVPVLYRDEIQRLAQFASTAMNMQPRGMRNNMEDLAESLSRLAGLLFAPPAPVEARAAALPAWWDAFILNVCEIPDRNSPDDEPEAMVATRDELEACALRAIEDAAPSDAPAQQGDPAAPRDDSDRSYDRPVGYLPAYELSRLHSGHDARLRSARFGPSELDGDVPVYLEVPAPAAQGDERATLSTVRFLDGGIVQMDRSDYDALSRQPSAPASEEVIDAGQSLLTRLYALEFRDDDVGRDFNGHVMPAMWRFRAALAAAKPQGDAI